MAVDPSVFYKYDPSLVAAAVACALFAVTTILHLYQMIATRAWYMVPLFLGCLCEVVGYIGRAISASEYPDVTLGPYIIQSLLLLIAPALIAASVYMSLGHVVLVTQGERHCMLKENILTKVFVIGDIMSFLVQSTGASLLTKKDQDSKDAGNWIIIGGLAVQLFFFAFFMVVTIRFYIRIRKDPTSRSSDPNTPWRTALLVLFVISILIMVRSVFRLIEYCLGPNGYLLGSEVWLYVFDALLMFTAVVIFNVWQHPSQMSSRLKGRRAIHRVVLLEHVVYVTGGEKLSPASSV